MLPSLFRTEYGKIVAVLVRSFGLARVGAAEDLVSETFLLAAETWGMKGLPDNPTAWLYTVAKNKARDFLRREGLFAEKIRPALQQEGTVSETPDFDFSPAGFQDSQLRMMFALCHPALPAETQVPLCLRILCGFGIEEIAGAFLTSKSTINKRLTRGKARLRTAMTSLELPPEPELTDRLEGVLTTIYLLFNEGYHATAGSEAFRRDLCAEAIRLALLLTENERTNLPHVNALLALMCFQVSRFDARLGTGGELILYADQDRSRWDQRLIRQGRHFLTLATANGEAGRYQLEAAVAALHSQPEESTLKWPTILSLYNRLLRLQYSPVAALNRTYAYGRVYGPAAALAEALKIGLTGNLGYQLLLGELYRELGNEKQALEHFNLGLGLTANPAIRRLIERKMTAKH